jgi:nucleotide-binding universal stress UspA family protein
MYTRIIVALDGSALAEQILPYVQSVAERFGSTLTLVRAIPPVAQMTASVGPAMAGVPLDPSMIEQTLRTEEFETTQYLEHVANELGRQGISVQTEHVVGPAAEVLVECARQARADLIGLTTHGRGGSRRLVVGSVAESVLRTAPCPVLLVRVHSM